MPYGRFFVLLVLLVTLTGGQVAATCNKQEDAIASATRRAAAVFTGKVDSLGSTGKGDITAVITVKRVLKKSYNVDVSEYLSAGGKVRVRVRKTKASALKFENYHTGKLTEAAVDLQSLVDNFNCSFSVSDGFWLVPRLEFVKKLRVNDTKIFLVRKLEFRNKRLLTSATESPSMELDSPPLVVKLEMLERVAAVIKGKTTNTALLSVYRLVIFFGYYVQCFSCQSSVF
jgi:hypothetical protein